MTPPTQPTVLLEALAAICSLAVMAGVPILLGRFVVWPWRRPQPVLPTVRRRWGWGGVTTFRRGTHRPRVTPPRRVSPVPGLGRAPT